MNTMMVNLVLGILTKLITEEMVLAVVAGGLDLLEDTVTSSENELDDAVIVPVLNVVRSALKLPVSATEVVPEEQTMLRERR